MSDYPKKMVHPSYHKAQSQIYMQGRKVIAAQSEPDRLPPVWVNNPHQEAYERSNGYRVEGEAMSETTFQRYPMWMKRERKNGEGHSATEEILVSDAREESEAVSKGFKAPHSNPAAYENAQADPPPDDYVVVEYPKYLGQDANGRDIVVNSREEELRLRPKPETPTAILSADAKKQARSEKMKAAWVKRKAAKAAEART